MRSDRSAGIGSLRWYACGKATGCQPPIVVEAFGIGFDYKREEAFAQSGYSLLNPLPASCSAPKGANLWPRFATRGPKSRDRELFLGMRNNHQERCLRSGLENRSYRVGLQINLCIWYCGCSDLKNRIGGNSDNGPWRMQGYSLDQR